jgi:hypothetical protein
MQITTQRRPAVRLSFPRVLLAPVAIGLLESCGGSGASTPATPPVSTSSNIPGNTLLCNSTASPGPANPCPLYTVSPEAYGAKGDGTTDDTAAIQSAIGAAANAGGGVVALRAVSYYIPGGLTLISGVRIRGLGCNFNGSLFGAYVRGTRLLGNNTHPGVSYLPGTYSSQPPGAAALAEGLSNAGVENLCIDSATYGLEFGSLYNSGLSYGSDIQNVAVINASVWGIYCENCSEFAGDTLYNFFLKQGGIGQMYFGTSQRNYNHGNYTLMHLYGLAAYGGQRGILFQAHAGSNMNDVNVFDIQVTQTGYYGGQVQAATMSGGSPSIIVTDASYFPVDMPVTFCTSGKGNANGFVCDETYFVVAQSGNTIQVGPAQRDAAITPTGNAAVNIITYGWPGFEVSAYRAANDPYSDGIQSSIQSMVMDGVDVEGTATTLFLAQQAHLSLGLNFTGGASGQGTSFASELTGRYMAGDYRSNTPIVSDTDQFSNSWYVMGAQLRTTATENGAPQFLPQGIFTYNTGSALNIASASTEPTLVSQSLYSVAQGFNPATYPAVAMGQKTQAVTSNGALPLGSANTGSLVFATSDTKAITLPTLDGQPALANANTWAGTPYELINGGRGLITVVTAPGQYFNRNAALAVGGVSSIGVLPYATLTLRAHHDGTTSFWEVVSLSPSLFAFSAAGTPLPPCNAALFGQMAIVADAAAPTYNSSYTSGGAAQVPVYCNGTSWTTH